MTLTKEEFVMRCAIAALPYAQANIAKEWPDLVGHKRDREVVLDAFSLALEMKEQFQELVDEGVI